MRRCLSEHRPGDWSLVTGCASLLRDSRRSDSDRHYGELFVVGVERALIVGRADRLIVARVVGDGLCPSNARLFFHCQNDLRFAAHGAHGSGRPRVRVQLQRTYVSEGEGAGSVSIFAEESVRVGGDVEKVSMTRSAADVNFGTGADAGSRRGQRDKVGPNTASYKSYKSGPKSERAEAAALFHLNSGSVEAWMAARFHLCSVVVIAPA